MTSHGHGIARATRPRTEQQRQIDLEKVNRYRSLEDQVREKAVGKDYGQETFDLTSKLLRINPEYYTIWNVRRRCITPGFSSRPSAGSPHSKVLPTSSPTDTPSLSSATSSSVFSAETPQPQDPPTAGKSGTTPDWDHDLAIIKSELTFTVPLLLEFPKCYWIWNYRLWTLAQAIECLPAPVARKVWEEELGLVGKMLHRDQRNFHAWGYRRYVVDRLESPELNGTSLVEPEFQYTTKMINNNLSNFSAWHYRSQIIPRLLRERGADDETRRKFLENELSTVRGGLNVGPEDQSLWFYHQYLISNIMDEPNDETIAPGLAQAERRSYVEAEIEEIKDLLEDYQDIKWVYEALIQYSVALSRLGKQAPTKKSDEWAPWLQRLRALDPQRSGRWDDLEKQIGIV